MISLSIGVGIGGQRGRAVVYTAPTIAAVGTLAEGIGDIAPAWPAHQTNDIGLMIVEGANDVVTTPSGWNMLTPYSNGAAGAATSGRLSFFWRRAASGAETAPTVTGPIDHTSGLIMSIRGCPTDSTPVMTQTGLGGSFSANPITFPELTTALPNCLVVQVVGRLNDAAGPFFANWTNANLTGFTELYDGGTALGHGGGFAIAAGVMPVAGAIGATAVDTTENLPASLLRGTFAFRPS